MSDHRGEYRPIFRVLLDDPDYQSLTPSARLTLVTVKLDLGAPGIGVIYGEQLVVQTGLTRDEIEGALTELEAARWIKRSGYVLWLKNGLRFEPSFSSRSAASRTHVQRTIAGLPATPLTAEFRAAYREWFDTDDAHSDMPNLREQGPTEAPAVGPSEGPTEGPVEGPLGVGVGVGVSVVDSAPPLGKAKTPPTRSKLAQRRGAKNPRLLRTLPTWLTPAAEQWDRRNGPGSFPLPEAAKALAPIHNAGVAPEEIGLRLGRYLDAKRARGRDYFGVRDFAKEHARYAGELCEDGVLTTLGELLTRPSVGAA